MNIRLLAAAAALAISAGAQAAPVFSDSFTGNATGVDLTPAGWTVSSGTNDVDIIGNGYFDFIPANGVYIDLGGSNNVAGAAVLSTSFAATAGDTYTATFQLAGNQRGAGTDTVTVMLGDTAFTSPVLNSADGFATFSITTVATGSSLTLSFEDSRDGNIGALLDNVSVSAVPEPTNVALMMAGLLGLGFAARRRRG